MNMPPPAHQRQRTGLALTLVILIIFMVTLVSAAALSLGYNQRLLAKKAVGSRTRAYYYAKAGLVDALELLRKDPGGNFTDPDFDPAPYTLDIDADGNADVTIDISAEDPSTRRRTIQSTGSA